MKKTFDLNVKTKRELQRILMAYQQAIDINIICSITDIKGTILYVNKIFCKVSKYSEEELIGRNHNLINSGHHPKDFFKQMWQTISKGLIWHGEVKNKAKDGTFYWVATTILPIKDDMGNVVQFFSLREDITEKKEKEVKEQQYLASIEKMLFMVSHKIRKPVTNCIGLITLVEEEKTMSQDDLKVIINHFKSSAMELDMFTQELTHLICDIEQKARIS